VGRVVERRKRRRRRRRSRRMRVGVEGDEEGARRWEGIGGGWRRLPR
jgi:hypothetical protein